MKNPEISIVIVSYNTKEDLKQCLNGLRKQSIPLEVFVVDNCSADDSIEMMKSDFSGWSELKIIENKSNLGFTSASNQPLELCRGNYVLFLNSDTIIKSDSMNRLVEYFESNLDVGVVGPKLLYGDLSLQLSCFSSSSVSNLFNILLWHLLPWNLAEDFFIKSRYGKLASLHESQVGWVSGACLMIRRDLVLKLGGFDENFFLSAQDSLDLCARVRQEGYKVMYYPAVEIIHYCGRSTKKDAGADNKVRFLMFMHYGHLYYYRKHHGYLAMMFLKVIFSTLSLVKGAIAGLLFMATFSRRYKTIFESRMRLAYKILFVNISTTPSYIRK